MLNIPSYTSNDFLANWIRSTIRDLLANNADEQLIRDIFGEGVITHVRNPSTMERVYAEAFYGDYHHPLDEFQTFIQRLMTELPFEILCNNIQNAGSYRSWMDLRLFVSRPEFNNTVLTDLEQRYTELYYRSTIQELRRLYENFNA